MKVLTVFGTRPEIIRLSLISKILDQHCDHVMVHTGQNFDDNLSGVFLRELGARDPDFHLGITATDFAEQISGILTGVDKILKQTKPDKLLILGDTNSALSAIVAARRGVPIFHMEAGNRCYDDRVPEEINRRLIDHISTILMPYTHGSKENLMAEGIPGERILVTGNPIFEVLTNYQSDIEGSSVLEALGLKPFEYFLVTLHRAENVDRPDRLLQIFEGLGRICEQIRKRVVLSCHPKTKDRLTSNSVKPHAMVEVIEPLGFFDFVALEKSALAVLTDSGTVQEECAIFGIPNVTIRDVTERPETLECGSNVISGGTPDSILSAVQLAIAQPSNWEAPREYTTANVSQIVSKIILSYTSLRKHWS